MLTWRQEHCSWSGSSPAPGPATSQNSRPPAKSPSCWPACEKLPDTTADNCPRWPRAWSQCSRVSAGGVRTPGVSPLVTPQMLADGHRKARELASGGPAGLLHGDLHLSNILRAGPTRGLVAIDPRPGVGDLTFDAIDWTLDRAASIDEVRERIDQLGKLVAGMDRDRLWRWCQATAPALAVLRLARRPPDDTTQLLMKLAALSLPAAVNGLRSTLATCGTMSRSAGRLRSPGEGPRQARPTTPGDHDAEVPAAQALPRRPGAAPSRAPDGPVGAWGRGGAYGLPAPRQRTAREERRVRRRAGAHAGAHLGAVRRPGRGARHHRRPAARDQRPGRGLVHDRRRVLRARGRARGVRVLRARTRRRAPVRVDRHPGGHVRGAVGGLTGVIDEPVQRRDEGTLRALVPRVLAGLVRRGE